VEPPLGAPRTRDLISTPTSQWIPDAAAASRVPVRSVPHGDDSDVGAEYLGDQNRIDVYPENLQRTFQGYRNLIMAHEAGHSIYTNNTTPEKQQAWIASTIRLVRAEPNQGVFAGTQSEVRLARGHAAAALI
jgi:hypothetical protein